MKNDEPLTKDIMALLRQAIKTSLSVRHIPAVITQVTEIPVTTSM